VAYAPVIPRPGGQRLRGLPADGTATSTFNRPIDLSMPEEELLATTA
jgi:hypothetical protein